MSAKWTEDDEEFRLERVKGGLRSKPRFSFDEVKLLLEAVKRNRYIVLRKFNHGVSAEAKKQTWAEITDQVNSLGENQREVRQIMKKWADLKCDGKRRMAALRGPNGSNVRKKKLGPVERMVHKILMLSPQGGCDSDLEMADDENFSKFYGKGPHTAPTPYSYLSLTDISQPLPGGASFDISPLSSPEKELGGDPVHSSSDLDLADEGDRSMDFEDTEDALFSSYPSSAPPPTSLDPLPDNALTRVKPVHTYSRTSQGQNPTQSHAPSSPPSSSRPPPGPSSSVASTSSDFPSVSDSDAAPPPSQSPTSSKVTASSSSTSSSLPAPPSSLPPPSPASSSPSVAASDATSQPAASSTSIPPPPPPPPPLPPAYSNSRQPPPYSSVLPPSQPPPTSDPLPAGASSRRQPDHVAQMVSQSLQQQRASRMLLTSVSQSLEVLAQSVQLLVESQQEFVQESLLLQRETVDILKDFSNTALTMLRDKANSGQLTYHHPASYF